MERDPTRKQYFVFQKPGYETQRRARVVDGQEIAVHALLPQLETSVYVDTEPRDANVSLSADGKVVYQGRIDDTELWNNKDELALNVVVTAPWHKPESRQVVVRRGIRNTFSIVLAPMSVEIAIDSDPSSAKAYDRNLGYLGTTPLTEELARRDLDLTDGRLQLTVVKGNLMGRATLDIAPDTDKERYELVVALQPLE